MEYESGVSQPCYIHSFSNKIDNSFCRSGRLALKSLTQFVYTYGAQTLGETSLRILNYMPLLAHFSFDQGYGMRGLRCNLESAVIICEKSAEFDIENDIQYDQCFVGEINLLIVRFI